MLVLYYRGKLVTRLPISVMKQNLKMTELEAFLRRWFTFDKLSGRCQNYRGLNDGIRN